MHFQKLSTVLYFKYITWKWPNIIAEHHHYRHQIEKNVQGKSAISWLRVWCVRSNIRWKDLNNGWSTRIDGFRRRGNPSSVFAIMSHNMRVPSHNICVLSERVDLVRCQKSHQIKPLSLKSAAILAIMAEPSPFVRRFLAKSVNVQFSG